MSIEPIRQEIIIDVSPERAFRVFTEEHGAWWPLATHHIGAQPAETAIIEPRVGGRWFERAADGSECMWGRVLAWDPPARLVLAWQIGSNFKYDEQLSTEVELRFVAMGPAKTRVELEHRHLERAGAAAEDLRRAVNSGWSALLKLFADKAAAR
ncbi:MAG: SRPBCC family protein [Xanthobacteraceae bacterium]